MKLNQAIRNIPYRITSIHSDETNSFVIKKLFQLGIMEGAEIKLKRKAPLFGDPLLFDIGGFQVAFTKKEASYISIEQVEVK